MANLYTRHCILAFLLSELELNGFQLGIDRQIRLLQLLECLPYEIPSTDLAHYLCPIFAVNEHQQDQFHLIFFKISSAVFKEENLQPDVNLQKINNPTSDITPALEKEAPSLEIPIKKENEQLEVIENLERPRGPLSLDLERCSEPPYVWNIALDENIIVEFGNNIDHTLIQLRGRELMGTKNIDWPATLYETVKQPGVLHLSYTNITRPIEYLLLVERFAIEDHRAMLFDSFYRTLRNQEVRVDRFFHDGDFQTCHNEQFPLGISLRDLQQRFSHARLVVQSSGYKMLNPKTGKLAEWTSLLNNWQSRTLLTPVSKQQWGKREQRLTNLFSLMPAAWESIQYISAIPSHSVYERFSELPPFVRDTANWRPITLEKPFMRALRRHFEPNICIWVALCGIWPTLHFDLTLYLGRLISAPESNILTYSNLTYLSRIDWFVNGYIPLEARRELLEFLEANHPELLGKANEHLLELMRKNIPQNVNSHAYAEHQINVAILQVMSDKVEDPILVENLRTVLKRLNREIEVTDFVLPHTVEKMLEKLGMDRTAILGQSSEENNDNIQLIEHNLEGLFGLDSTHSQNPWYLHFSKISPVISDYFSILHTVNCDRRKELKQFRKHYNLHQTNECNLAYCVIGCPSQKPDSLVERIVYELLEDYNDPHYVYYYRRTGPKYRSILIQSLPFGFFEEKNLFNFKKFFAEQFRGTDSFEDFFQNPKQIDIFHKIIFAFKFTKDQWGFFEKDNDVTDYIARILDEFARLSSSHRKFVFFFIFDFPLVHEVQSKILQHRIELINSLSNKNDAYTQFCTINSLNPVPEEEIENWLLNMGLIGNEVKLTIKALQEKLTMKKREIALEKKLYDMEDIEDMQRGLYVYFNERI